LAEQLLPKEPDVEKLFAFEDALLDAGGCLGELDRELEQAAGALLSIATREGDARTRYGRRLDRFYSDMAILGADIAGILLGEKEGTPLDWLHGEMVRVSRAADGVARIVKEFVDPAAAQDERE
jgi:hypothetical protein